MKHIDPNYLFATYDALLIDAYGVLVDAHGMLPGADAFVARLHRERMPFCIVTNDASKSIERISARFASFGLDIDAPHIVSSASLIDGHIERAGLQGCDVAVLGPPDAHAFVAAAGAKPVRVQDAQLESCRAIIVCDVTSHSMHDELSAAINLAIARVDAGLPFGLVLCNPDIIYPAGNRFGMTSGALMLVIEGALRSRFGEREMPPIARLGKPFRTIFKEGARRTGGKRLALLGDQLPTDVRGALDFGIDAVLVGTGLTKVRQGQTLSPMPTHYLEAVHG